MAPPRPLSVLLVDSNELLRGAVTFLEPSDAFVVEYVVPEDQKALRRAAAGEPDVVVCGLSVSGPPDVNTIHYLRSLLPKARVVALVQQDTPVARTAALKAGADAVVATTRLQRDLSVSLRRLFDDET